MRSLVPLLAALVACQGDYGISSIPDTVDLPADQDDGQPLEADEPADEPVDDPGELTLDSAAPVDETVATAPVYAHTNDRLYTVDPVTGAASLVGLFQLGGSPLLDVVDIAIDQDGRLIGGTQGEGEAAVGRAIYQIDPVNASATWLCDVDVVMYALAFLPDGRLLAGGFESLHAIDLDHGCAVSLLLHDGSYTTSGDLVALPDGMIYWTVRGPEWGDGDRLVVVDPNMLRDPEERGDIGFNRLFGLGYDQAEERLYGFSADGEIVAIDPVTAQASVLVSEGAAWWGATTNPVVWR